MIEHDTFPADLQRAFRELAGEADEPAGLAERLISTATRPPRARARGRRWIAPVTAAAVAVVIAATLYAVRPTSHRSNTGMGGTTGSTLFPAASPTPDVVAAPVFAAIPRQFLQLGCLLDGWPANVKGSREPLVTVDPDPTAVTAIWFSGLNVPCTTRSTLGGAALAATLANDIRSATENPPGVVFCPSDGASGVTLYFSYADQAEAEEASLTFTGCSAISAPGRQSRNPGSLRRDLQPIAP